MFSCLICYYFINCIVSNVWEIFQCGLTSKIVLQTLKQHVGLLHFYVVKQTYHYPDNHSQIITAAHITSQTQTSAIFRQRLAAESYQQATSCKYCLNSLPFQKYIKETLRTHGPLTSENRAPCLNSTKYKVKHKVNMDR